MKLREEASAILGVRIEADHWKSNLERLDVSGGFTRRKEMELLIMLCERLEKLEDYVYTDRGGSNTNSPIQPPLK